MRIEYAEMMSNDYDQAVALWQSVEGIGLDDDTDSREAFEACLKRNPGMSFIARDDGKTIGTVLCGHDGRRGYLHHLAVAVTHRGRGIGKALVERCISGLRGQGINKCNIMVFGDNLDGLGFWKASGWTIRQDLLLMQKWTGEARCPGRSC